MKQKQKQKQKQKTSTVDDFKQRNAAYIETTKVSKIKVQDRGSVQSAVFLNPKKVDHTVWKMDGGILKNTTCADWMVSKLDTGDIVVELKGGDVAKALTQVQATATYAKANEILTGKLAGLVLCTQHPGISTKIQRAMSAFARDFKGPLHVRCRGGEFVFEHVLSFNGPERL
jgi:hypothetical protein